MAFPISSTAYITADDSSPINSLVGCNSIKLAGGQTWRLNGDASGLIGTKKEYSFGFLVNFQSTISDNIFQFGPDTGPKYVVSSTKDGTLKISFYSDATTTSSTNDIPITVLLSNFYTDKWILIVFHFKSDSGSVTLDVILPKTAIITKTSATFALPGGKFYFGKGIKANFSEIILIKTATINASLDTITLDDGNTQLIAASPCINAEACSDDVCIGSDSVCLASKQFCTTCDANNGCTVCDPDSARNPSNWCSNCKDATVELKNFHCCAVGHNCAGCSKKSTQCDVCPTQYFLYDESGTSTTCLSCTDSCVSCKPGPTCYTCAEAITQTGSTCRIDSVGFEISFDFPNIVIDFAHPLSTGLTKSSLTASSASTQTIPTAGWTLTGCVAGNLQCNIVTDNVHESDLPITLNIEFAQA